MRFHSDGPNIPNSLLKIRDEGQVVFLCGAGVSMPAGMPSFVCLTNDVLTNLRTPEGAPVRAAFGPWLDGSVPVSARTPLDQIFNTLIGDYGRAKVHKHVAQLLSSSADTPEPREHSIIARLSADLGGLPQIVTTNFDLLFERPGVTALPRIFEPPELPDLRHKQPISGLTYLHGRIGGDERRSNDFILSSADFGRAYLSEGWATRFVRLLLERHTVVLLGYQAEDPPMQYLLQGLNSGQSLDSGRLYAFDRGEPGEVETKWRDRGVQAIAYQGEGNDHSRLWDTLGAWADRADDPLAWRGRVIDMARQGPRSLQAHERGQVAHVVRTSLGAKEFAAADPSPPAEWLCVFDRGRRLAEPEEYHGDDQEFVPYEQYGLDDDPVERREDGPRRGPIGDDFVSWLPGDERPVSEFSLSAGVVRGFEVLPPRLFHLARWSSAKVGDPAFAWWVARQQRLHPRLAAMIASQVRLASLGSGAGKRIWSLILEAHEGLADSDRNSQWFSLRSRIARDGATPRNLRDLEICTEPSVAIRRTFGRRQVQPPQGTWEDVDPNEIAAFEVNFPNPRRDRLNVPDGAIAAVFAIAARNLIRGLERMEELGKPRLRVPTLHPDEERLGRPHRSDSIEYVFWVADLMGRSAQVAPRHVLANMSLWPDSDSRVLLQLRLLGWGLPSVFSGPMTAGNLMALSDRDFWSLDSQRDLLFLTRDRWGDFCDDERRRIVERLLAGPNQRDDEEADKYFERRDCSVVTRLRWLNANGCDLAQETLSRLDDIQAALPEWNDDWVSAAARSLEGRSGSIQTVRDASVFDGVPVSRIVETARAGARHEFREFAEHKPFEALVREQPRRALFGLGFAARRGEHPTDLWSSLIREWPADAPARPTSLLYARMRRLPDELVREDAYTYSSWMRDQLSKIAKADEAFALALFDDLFGKIISGGAEATEIRIGEATMGGYVGERSRRTIDHANGDPVGQAMEALLSILEARDLPEGHGMPEEFSTRFERLLAAPGEGSDHAVWILMGQLALLHQIAPEWVRFCLIPLFTLDHQASESAWNGLLSQSDVVGPDIFEIIKPQFLALFPHMYDWRWRDDVERTAHNWLVMTAIWHEEEPRYTSAQEASDAIRRLSDGGRVDVIHQLARVGQSNGGGWRGVVIPFLRAVWPKELRFHTEGASSAFASLLDDAGDCFPEVFEQVREFLRPIRHGHHSFYRFHRSDEGQPESLASRFPGEALGFVDLVVSDDPLKAPYDLEEVVSVIIEARPDLAKDRRVLRLRDILARR